MNALLTLLFLALFPKDVLGVKEQPYHASTDAELNRLEGPHGLPTAHRPPHTRRPGFYDPHNHWTGIISWNGIGLATENGKAAMETEMDNAESRETLDAFKQKKCGIDTQGESIEGSRAPFKNEDQMYVYQFLHSGKICGIEICVSETAEFASLCKLMKKISHAVNKVLAEYLTDQSKIFDQSPMAVKDFLEPKNVYGTMTLHPLLKCAQEIVGHGLHTEEAKEKLANTLMSAMSASPMIDFDTSYASRGYVMKTYGNYCWINDFTLQTLIDDDVSYVEVANSIGKVSKSMKKDTTECMNCCAAAGDIKACKGCEYTMLNKKLKINMFGHNTESDEDKLAKAGKKQEFVHVKWNMMHLTSTFASTDTCKAGNKPARIVQTVDGTCHRKGGRQRLQCTSGLKDGCGKCDNEQSNMGDNDGMFTGADGGKPGLGDIMEMCPRKPNTPVFTIPTKCSHGKDLKGPNCWPLLNEDIAGMDYASPESSCFQAAAVTERMDQHLQLVYMASKQVNEGKSGSDIVPKVYHVHCGEGYPIYDKNKYFVNYPKGKTAVWNRVWDGTYNDNNYEARRANNGIQNEFNMKPGEFKSLCEEAGTNYDKQKHFDVVYCGHFALSGDMMPCHAITARHNMVTLATGIEDYIKAKPLENFEQLVTVRFGHATWATYSIAQTMRTAGIHADCNLASNLATQAYTWPVKKDNDAVNPGEDHERPTFLFTKDPGDQKTSIHTMIDALNNHDDEQRKLLVRGFANHGFLRLFIAGVKVELGSDGAGVEHSKHGVDYKVAKILIHHLVHYHDHSWNKPAGNADEWEWKLLNKWDADEIGKKLPKDKWNIDTLIGYSKSIHENMNQPAAAGGDATAVAGGDATAVASPETRFQSTSKTGLRSNNK